MIEEFLSELKRREPEAITTVMAFMSYIPSIGRVFEKGGVSKFEAMAVKKINELSKIKDLEGFDNFHQKWVEAIISNIKTSKGSRCSYGQAQKPINVFLKVYVDWAKLPALDIANKLIPFLHVPLDRILMTSVNKELLDNNDQENKVLKDSSKKSLSSIDKETYLNWQSYFRKQYPEKPLLFDVLWATRRKG